MWSALPSIEGKKRKEIVLVYERETEIMQMSNLKLTVGSDVVGSREIDGVSEGCELGWDDG